MRVVEGSASGKWMEALPTLGSSALASLTPQPHNQPLNHAITHQVLSLSDQNQAFVFRIKQLESYVVSQKEAMRTLQAQVAALSNQQGVRIRGEALRSASGGGGSDASGGGGGAISSFPVNLTPSSSPERSAGGAGFQPVVGGGSRAVGGEDRSGSDGRREDEARGAAWAPAGGKFWATVNGGD